MRAFSFGWLNPMSSLAAVLATSSIVALAWAFQQQGWSSCIPCVVFAARKISGVRTRDVTALARHAGAFMRSAAERLFCLSARFAPC